MHCITPHSNVAFIHMKFLTIVNLPCVQPKEKKRSDSPKCRQLGHEACVLVGHILPWKNACWCVMEGLLDGEFP